MRRDPGIKVEGFALDQVCGFGRDVLLNSLRKRAKLFLGYRDDCLWRLKDVRHPVRAESLGVVALAVHGAGDAPDAGRVADGLVHMHMLVGRGGEAFQALLHQAAVIGGEIDGVHELRPVARISHDRLRPAQRRETVADFPDFSQGGFVFGIGARYAGGPVGVAVDEEPLPAGNVPVGGGRLMPADGPDAVDRAGQEVAPDRIRGRVDSPATVEFADGLGGIPDVFKIKVPRDRMFLPAARRGRAENTDFEDIPGLEPKGQCADDFFFVCHVNGSLFFSALLRMASSCFSAIERTLASFSAYRSHSTMNFSKHSKMLAP